ncbi:tyrosine-protein phosphatase non-receptor type 18 [Salarias fasciatus]|uniref:protein-tyrosine-phosphatase n=1 Tax=Salarias fasciatus TaxID=181472 RepID=A0A672HWR2_SALFA|nr:tyrosine-protein phosphatase non-receptor type 18-like [Salarias fasciatus]
MDPLASLLSSLKAKDPLSVAQEYSVVRSRTSSIKNELGLTCEVGALKENIKKNRYKDILPYDQTRVVLPDSDSDYINASFIQGATEGCRYIACQGPLSSTLTHFWTMIWQYNVKVIVMASREIEMGKRKCECYWAAEHQEASFGPFTVTTQGETKPSGDMVIRTLRVSYLQEVRHVTQHHFLSWPDHDVPQEPFAVLDLLQGVRSSRGGDTSPLLVHCSAGCGRTGVICALDYIHDLLVTKQVTEDLSILKVVLELRQQRPSAVQTKEQYQFIFTAVCCMLERLLQSCDQHLYSNLSQLKTTERRVRATKSASSSSRLSLGTNMDTYAVVNKHRQPHPPASSPAHPPPTPSSGGRPITHLYDNESGASATPIYSVVRPRSKAPSRPHSAMTFYDFPTPANQRPAETQEYQLVSAEQDSDYEDVSSSEASGFSSPSGIGFNNRVERPKGPREPPAEWSRLER